MGQPLKVLSRDFYKRQICIYIFVNPNCWVLGDGKLIQVEELLLAIKYVKTETWLIPPPPIQLRSILPQYGLRGGFAILIIIYIRIYKSIKEKITYLF